MFPTESEYLLFAVLITRLITGPDASLSQNLPVLPSGHWQRKVSWDPPRQVPPFSQGFNSQALQLLLPEKSDEAAKVE